MKHAMKLVLVDLSNRMGESMLSKLQTIHGDIDDEESSKPYSDINYS